MPDYASYCDDELLELMRHGDERAFAEIYYRYWKPMFFIAGKKIQDLQEAEGLVQDIFLDLWRRRQQIKIETGLRPYLSVAVKYKVINILAKRKRHLEYQLSLKKDLPPADCSTEEWIYFNEIKARLSRLVAQLPDKCRMVYELSRDEGYSQKQIADVLGITEKTVEAHLTRALKNIRKGLIHIFFFLLSAGMFLSFSTFY